MTRVVAFGDIGFELAGGHARRPGAGRVERYAWWQARGFDVRFALLDGAGEPAREAGTVAFVIHRRPRPRMRPEHYAPDASGIQAARETAAAEEDDVFYEIPVPAAESDPGRPVSFHEEQPVIWWPVGVQSYADFRITAWFVPAGGPPSAFTEQEITVYWMDVQDQEKAEIGRASG